MSGWPVSAKWAEACRFGLESQQPVRPQTQALAQVQPCSADVGAGLATVGAGTDGGDEVEVGAGRTASAHRTPGRSAPPGPAIGRILGILGSAMDDTEPSRPPSDARAGRPAPGSRAADAEAAGPAPDGPIVPANQAQPGPANARWRALLAEGGADPGRRRDGHDALCVRAPVRRPARGMECQQLRSRPADPPRLPGRRLADRHDEHVRREPAAAAPPRAGQAGRRAQPDGGDPPPGRGRCGRRPRTRRRRHRADRRDHGAARDAGRGRGGRRLRGAGGGPDRRRGRPDLDRDDVPPVRDRGGDPRRPPGVGRRSRSSPR